LLLTAALGVASAPVHAQERAGARPPLRPAGEVARDPRDAGFDEWNAARTEPRAVAPMILTGGRNEFVVHSVRSRERATVEQDLRRALASCASRFDITEEVQERLVTGRAFRAFDASVTGVPLLMITIVPSTSRPVGCADSAADELVLLEHGLRVTADTIPFSANDVASVEVLLGDRRIAPTLLAGGYVTRIAPEGFVALDGSGFARVYLDIDALAPRGSALPRLRLRVGTEMGSVDEFEVSPRVLDELWREVLPWRAARLLAASGDDAPVVFPTPADPELRSALEDQSARAIVAHSERILIRLDSPLLLRGDRVSALMHVGFGFSTLGDDASARVLLRRALQLEPCLRLSATAPAAGGQLLDEVRPVVRCDAVPAIQVVRWGLVPGRAQRRLDPDRFGSGFLPLALTTTSALASVVLHLKSDALFANYQRELVDPARSFEEARDMHVLANRIGVATYALWGASIAQAIYSERRLARRSAAVSDYGADQGRRVRVGPASQGFGLSLSVF